MYGSNHLSFIVTIKLLIKILRKILNNTTNVVLIEILYIYIYIYMFIVHELKQQPDIFFVYNIVSIKNVIINEFLI